MQLIYGKKRREEKRSKIEETRKEEIRRAEERMISQIKLKNEVGKMDKLFLCIARRDMGDRRDRSTDCYDVTRWR